MIIDYIIIKQRTQLKLLDVRVQRRAECGSDHFMVKARLAFPYSTNLISEERNYTDMEDFDVPEYMLEGLTEESTKKILSSKIR